MDFTYYFRTLKLRFSSPSCEVDFAAGHRLHHQAKLNTAASQSLCASTVGLPEHRVSMEQVSSRALTCSGRHMAGESSPGSTAASWPFKACIASSTALVSSKRPGWLYSLKLLGTMREVQSEVAVARTHIVRALSSSSWMLVSVTLGGGLKNSRQYGPLKLLSRHQLVQHAPNRRGCVADGDVAGEQPVLAVLVYAPSGRARAKPAASRESQSTLTCPGVSP